MEEPERALWKDFLLWKELEISDFGLPGSTPLDIFWRVKSRLLEGALIPATYFDCGFLMAELSFHWEKSSQINLDCEGTMDYDAWWDMSTGTWTQTGNTKSCICYLVFPLFTGTAMMHPHFLWLWIWWSWSRMVLILYDTSDLTVLKGPHSVFVTSSVFLLKRCYLNVFETEGAFSFTGFSSGFLNILFVKSISFRFWITRCWYTFRKIHLYRTGWSFTQRWFFSWSWNSYDSVFLRGVSKLFFVVLFLNVFCLSPDSRLRRLRC